MKISTILSSLVLAIFLFGCQQVSYKQEAFSDETIALLEGLQPKMVEKGQFRIYYPADSKAAGFLDDIGTQLQSGKAKVLALLQKPNYEEPLNILVVDNEAEVASLTGISRREFTIPPDRFSIIVADGEREAYFTRGLFKIMAFHFWGNPRDIVLFEGGAVFAQGSCLPVDDPLYQIPALARASDKMCDLRSLIGGFGDCAKQYPVTTYMLAGATFRLLFDGFGLETTQRIWTGGIRNLERLVGMAPIELERELNFAFDNVTLDTSIDLDQLNETGCQ